MSRSSAVVLCQAIALCALCVLPAIASAQTPAAQEIQLIPNGDIETINPDGNPASWAAGALKNGKGTMTVDGQVFHSGKHSLKIEKTQAEDSCHWQTSYFPLRITEETDAELSLWIKAEDIRWVTVVLTVESPTDQYFQYVTPFSIEAPFFDWKEFKANIKLKPGGTKARLFLRLNATGTVWFDDIRFVPATDIREKSQAPAAAPAPKPAVSTPAAAAKGGTMDSFEFKKYIKNTRMAGEGANELPAGWSVQSPPGADTVAKVTWAKDDPRPGYYALCLAWTAGTPYVAVQPELSGKVQGEQPLTLYGCVRTEAAGKAYFRACALNDAGKVIKEEVSKAVENAKEYAELTLEFTTPPDTKDVQVYCVNGGAGKVWFHWVTLEPNLQKVQATAFFPFTVSCEPPEGNRFWNGGKAVLNSFQDSPVGVSFAFWGDKSRLDNPRLVIEVPEGLAIPEAFNMDPRPPVSHAKAEFVTEKIVRGKAPYVRYAFAGPAALQRMTAEPYLYNLLTMCFVPQTYEKGKEYEIFYHAENAGNRNSEKQVTLRVLPPMAKTPNPKRFAAILWNLDDVNFYDMGLVEQVLRKFEEAGLTGREFFSAGRKEIIGVDQLLKKHGWLVFHKATDDAFEQSPFPAIGGDGTPSNDSRMPYCPSYAVTNEEFFQKYVISGTEKTVRETYGNGTIEDNEVVFLDFEPGSVGNKCCFCDRCRRLFAEKFNIPLDKVQTRRDILMNYRKEWGQFWCWLCDEIIRLHVRAVKAVNPTLKNYYYCYPLPFDNPEATEKILAENPLDTRLIQKHMDVLGLDFYNVRGKEALDLISVNTRVLKTPVYMMPGMFGAGPFISSWGPFTEDQILSPAAERLAVVTAAAGGAAGVIPYEGKLMDGMYFLSIDRAMSEIAAFEDFYMDGLRKDEAIRCEGLKELPGAAGKPLLQSHWESNVGVRAHELKGSMLITVFNFNEEKDAAVLLKIGGLGVTRWALKRGLTREPFTTPDGRSSLTSTELAAGVPCRVPAQDVLFLLVTPP